MRQHPPPCMRESSWSLHSWQPSVVLHFSLLWRWRRTTCWPVHLALRLIATGQPASISPERLADTARRAGIAVFVAVTAAAFALIWSVFSNDFSITYIMEHSNRALPGRVQIFRAVERAGRLAAAVGVAAGNLRLCAAADAQDGCEAVRLRRHHPGRHSGLLSCPSSASPRRRSRSIRARFPTTATA
jgi:hypothetical protein